MTSTTPFWFNDPTILLNKNSLFQLWPTPNLSFESKLNAISRLVILLSILGFLFTQKKNFIIIGVITLAIIFSLYKLRKQKLVKNLIKKEGFKVNEADGSFGKISSSATHKN